MNQIGVRYKMNPRAESYRQKILDHYNTAVASLDCPIFGCFLHGSQNYQLDDEFSDVDTRCFYIGELNKAVTAQYPASGGQTIFTSLARWLKKLSRGSFTQTDLEYFTTDYVIINPVYKEEWQTLQEMKTELFSIGYNPCATSVKNNYLSDYHFLTKQRYRPKTASHFYREEAMLEGLQEHLPLEDILKLKMLSAQHRNYLIDIKRGKVSCEKDIKKLDFNVNFEEPPQEKLLELKNKINALCIRIENKTKEIR